MITNKSKITNALQLLTIYKAPSFIYLLIRITKNLLQIEYTYNHNELFINHSEIKKKNTKQLLEDQDKDPHQKLLTQCKPAPTVSPKGSQMYIITEVIGLVI